MQPQTPTSYDVMVEPGNYFCDLIFVGLPAMPRLGKDMFATGFDILPGGIYNAVLALHRLGLKVAWPCDFGNDMFSQFVVNAARQEGLDTSLFQYHDHPVRSISTSISFPHDRAFVSYVDPMPPKPLLPLLRQYRPRCLLLMSLDPRPQMLELLAAAHEIGTTVVLDCQSHEFSVSNPDLCRVLSQVDVFIPNQSEALQLTGESELETALQRLSLMSPVVVIKRGSEGAIAAAGSELVQVDGLPDIQVVDTTGAGDCFDAGFIYGQLKKAPLETCLRYGNICGGLSTTSLGSASTPTEAQLIEWFARGK